MVESGEGVMPCAPHKPEYEYMPGAGGSPAGVGLAARGVQSLPGVVWLLVEML